ncbi:MAG TPA: MFS transporter [Burkholderiales bacterium]|nr:MFS transporter [Burkholderiales bacterium]
MTQPNQFDLLKQRRFGPFFGVQFLGAFNDNVYKNALVIMLAFQAASMTAMSSGLLVNLCAGLFILPFFLFSATAGQLADKYEKAKITRLVKIFEIVIMIVGALGFYFLNLTLLLIALFMMGMHSTMFGPVKYAYLPQHLKKEELVGGNGLIDAGTFIAILLGTILGGTLIGMQPSGSMWVSATAIGIAVLGYCVSRSVPLSPAPSPDLKINWNPFTETWANLKFLRTNRTVFLSILGISWFWFYGAMFLSQFPNYTKDVLGGSEQVVTLLLAVFSVGIGLGSLLCEKLSGHKIEIGLVPFGSIGLTIFAVDLYFASPSMAHAAPVGAMAFIQQAGSWRVLLDLLMIGIFGGFYIVPLYALIQSRSEPSHQSRVIAGNNILNALFMVLAAGVAILGLQLGMTIPQVFLLTGVLNALVAIYIYKLVPEFLMRFLVWLLIHTVYRLEKSGLEHIPEEGPAVIVCNHPSLVDALVIAAACRRPVRFVMDHHIFKTPVLNFIFRTSRAIPIAPAREDPVLLDRAYDDIAKALAEGDVVGIFPEGGLTKDGEIQPFRAGIKRIIERTPVPVVPMALKGLWGSFFSRVDGAAMKKPLRRGLLSKIALAVGAPVAPAAVTPDGLQQIVTQLRGDWK